MIWLWAALSGVVAIALCVALASYGRRRRRVHSPDALSDLADALRRVDLFGESQPELNIHADGAVSEVVKSTNHLLERVEHYKQKLVARDRRMRRLLGRMTDVLYQVDSNLRLTWVTASVESVLGYSTEEVQGHRISEFLVGPVKEYLSSAGRVQVDNYPVRVYRRDGSVAWLLVSARRLQDADGRFIGIEGAFRDGTELVEAEKALFVERERAQITLASIGDGVITTGTDGTVDYMNFSAETLTGETRQRAEGAHFGDVCYLQDNRTNHTVERLVATCIETGQGMHLHSEVTLHNPRQQREFAVRVNISPICDSLNEVIGTVVVLHDITELHEISRQMTHQATHDSLTGLANRQAFEQGLRGLLAQAFQDGTTHALCYLDLDQFKMVNDTCGHAAGDDLLCEIAEQLTSQIREHDSIARLGGDEFGILLRDTTLQQAAHTAQRMCRRIENFRFSRGNKLFRVGISIGLVPITRDSGEFNTILGNADAACYVAKEDGRNRVHVHFPGNGEVSKRHSDMRRMQHLSEAIDRNDFQLFTQVIRPVNWQPGDRVSLECLVRLRAADGTLLEPETFLPVAERYHVMSQIDRWVLKNALDLISDSRGSSSQVEYFSINLSVQSMTNEDFVDFVLSTLRRTDVDPTRLVFEITETSAVTNFNRAARLITVLRDLGCRFALDDFGSGLSSFSYLKNLPFDFIKIDGSFVRDILTDSVDLETVRAINQVGHAMGLQTIAEYVESESVLKKLSALGVDYAQGYYIDTPMPFEEWSRKNAQGREIWTVGDAEPLRHPQPVMATQSLQREFGVASYGFDQEDRIEVKDG